MLRTGIALGALVLLTPSIALAQALPVMSDGYSVETYAAVPDPVKISAAPDGTLFVGRDLSGSGGNSGAATRIHRVTPGNPPLVTEFGDLLDDPDAVLADPTGILAPSRTPCSSVAASWASVPSQATSRRLAPTARPRPAAVEPDRAESGRLRLRLDRNALGGVLRQRAADSAQSRAPAPRPRSPTSRSTSLSSPGPIASS
jgi:hypothetical protein